MREDVHVRQEAFPRYAARVIAIASPVCGKTYMYVRAEIQVFVEIRKI